MSKTTEVFQKPDKIPSVFYKRLYEAFQVVTPFDPEAQENQWVVNGALEGQAQEVI